MRSYDPDPGIEALLDLDGKGAYSVRFVAQRVERSLHRPHGLNYSLTLHGPDGGRWWDTIMPMRFASLVGREENTAVQQTTGTGWTMPGLTGSRTRLPSWRIFGLTWSGI